MSRYLALVVALAAGVLAVVLIYGYVNHMKKDVYKGMDMVPVLVAEKDIAKGTKLGTDNVAFRQFPQKFVSPRVISSKDSGSALGAVLVNNIDKGTPIYWSDLEEQSMLSKGIAELLQPGMTTFVMPVTDATGVGGMLKPNQRVDVVYMFDLNWLQGPNKPAEVEFQPQNVDYLKSYVMQQALQSSAGGDNPATAVLLQDVLVLATDKDTSLNMMLMDQQNNDAAQKEQEYTTITLMVTPLQSRILTFCMNNGSLSLALRKIGDSKREKDPRIVTKSLVLQLLNGTGADKTPMKIMD